MSVDLREAIWIALQCKLVEARKRLDIGNWGVNVHQGGEVLGNFSSLHLCYFEKQQQQQNKKPGVLVASSDAWHRNMHTHTCKELCSSYSKHVEWYTFLNLLWVTITKK